MPSISHSSNTAHYTKVMKNFMKLLKKGSLEIDTVILEDSNSSLRSSESGTGVTYSGDFTISFEFDGDGIKLTNKLLKGAY